VPSLIGLIDSPMLRNFHRPATRLGAEFPGNEQ